MVTTFGGAAVSSIDGVVDFTDTVAAAVSASGPPAVGIQANAAASSALEGSTQPGDAAGGSSLQ